MVPINKPIKLILMAICKRSYIALLFLLTSLSSSLLAQSNVFDITQGRVESCSGTFVDSGGLFSEYGPDENHTITICPENAGQYVKLTFTSGLDIADMDVLTIFDDTTANANRILITSTELDILSNPFSAQATAVNPTGCLTVTFVSNESVQLSGWSADVTCTQRCQMIEARIASSTPIINPPDTGYIDVCPGDLVTLSGQGVYPQDGLFYQQSDLTSTFLWNFGDGTEAVGPNVTHVYDEPGGYVIQLTITDTEGCTNSNFLTQRVRVAPYPNFSTFTDFSAQTCSNDTITLRASTDPGDGSNVVASPGEAGFLAGGVRSDSLALPDGTGTVYETSILLTDFGPGQVLENAADIENVFVNIEHSWMFDLDVFVRCPDGTQVILQEQTFDVDAVFLGQPIDGDENIPNSVGVGWDYFWVADPGLPTWREYWVQNDPDTLPSGNYRPSEPNMFEPLVGCPLNGEWTIVVQDLWAVDNGWIFEWGINFNPDIYPRLERFTVPLVDLAWEQNPSYLYNSADSIADILPFAGSESYTLSVLDEFGCTTDTTINVVVLPNNHPDCRDCQEIIQETADVLQCTPEAVSFDVDANVPTAETLVFSSSPNHPVGNANSPPGNPHRSFLAVNGVRPIVLNSVFTQVSSVCIDIETDWVDDLVISLIAPSGERLELSSNNGGGGQNYTNTCFSPNALTSITTAAAPFTGTFQPEGSWANLTGATINGNWALEISDAFGALQVGRLNSWSITFESVNAVTYNWTPATGLSCTDCPTPTANPGGSTDYILMASDEYGCTATDTISIVLLDDITAPIVSCEVTDLGQITYTWTQVNAFDNYEVNPIINGVESGWTGPVNALTYQVEGLSLNDVVELQVRVAPGANPVNCEPPIGSTSCLYDACFLTATTASIVGVSCFNYSDGTAEIAVDKGIAPFNYSLDGNPIQTSNIFTNLAVGTYTVVVEDDQQCQDSVTFSIANAAPFTVALAIDNTIDCFGEDSGGVSAALTGGTGTTEFFWNESSTAEGAIRTGLSAGEYRVQAVDSLGCIAQDTIALTQPDSLDIQLQVSSISCSGESDGQIDAVVTGGDGNYTFVWDSGPSTPGIIDLGAGDYCVTVTDGSGCQKIACTSLTAPVAIFIDDSSSTPVSCFGGSNGSATVMASGGTGELSYAWNDSLSQISNQAVFLRAGTYQVEVSDEAGCLVTADVQVGEPSPLLVTTKVTDAGCFEGKDGTVLAEPSGGVGPYSSAWDTGVNDSLSAGLEAGSYVVTVTDSNGCETEAFADVGQPATGISVDLTQTFMGCYGTAGNAAMVTASGGSNPVFTYAWSDPQQQTTPTATSLDSITYTVLATDGNGCTAEGTIKLRDLDPIQLNIIDSPPSCSGFSDGEMGINQISGGAGQGIIDNYTIRWSNNSTDLTIQGLLGGQEYQVTITDNQGCTGTGSNFLIDPMSITFDAQVQNALCFGSNDGAALVTNIQGEGTNFTINWDAATGSQMGNQANDLLAGSYGVTVTNEEGCFASDLVTVNQPPRIEVSYQTQDNECFGDQNGAIEANVVGGSPGYQYSWSNASTGTNLSDVIAGTYSLTVTDQNGCESITSAMVNQPDPLDISINGLDVSCFGGRDGSIEVEVAGGTGPFEYSLDNKNFTGSSKLIGLEQGEYNVFVLDANGCSMTSQGEVGSPLEFFIDPGDDITIVLGDTINLTAKSINQAGPAKDVELIWGAPYEGTLSCNECLSPSAYPINTITYDVLAIDENGCEADARITVFVEKPRLAVVPTGFTPNNDSKNDLLRVHGRDETIVKVFRVFDRWGELLYEKSNFTVNEEVGWDGTFRNKPMASGVYIWYMEVLYPFDDAEETKWGQTTLIR